MSAEWEVQKAIFAELSGNLSVPVFDYVPQEDTSSAYVTIGEDTFAPFNTDDIKGFEVGLVIHSWVIDNSRKTCKLLQGEIIQLLDRAELSITGYNLVGIDFEFSDTTPLEGNVYHGIQRFKITITEL